jgi:hypothetical protein
MHLSDFERERIRDAEIFKNEIRQEIQPQRCESRWSDFQQQIWLLVIGFVLTALVGGALTSWWKHWDFINQQKYLKAQRALDKKYAVTEKTFKEVATTLAAADDILTTYYGENWSSKQLEARRDYWDRTSRDWRVNSKVLSQDIRANFKNKDIVSRFQEIINKRRVLGNAVINLLTEKGNAKPGEELKNDIESANKLVEEIAKKLSECGDLMAAETAETR